MHSRKINAVECTIHFNFIAYKLEFNAKKAKADYHEQIASINSFVEKMREKMDILDVASIIK